MKFIAEWEEKMTNIRKDGEKPARSQSAATEPIFMCRWQGCQRICRSKVGLIQHERRVHEQKDREKFVRAVREEIQGEAQPHEPL